jgi:hypothetical protein
MDGGYCAMHPHHPCLILEIIIREYACPPAGPRHIVLGIPEITKKGLPVANFPVSPTDLLRFPLIYMSAGAVVPAPAGATFTVTTSAPNVLKAEIGTMSASGLPALVINRIAMTMPDDVTVTVTDSIGSVPATQIFSADGAVPVPDGVSISIDTVNVERGTQPAPTI